MPALTFVISFFAIVGIGAIAAPLNPSFTEEELAFYVDNCKARALITEKRILALCQSISMRSAEALPVIHATPSDEAVGSFQHLINNSAPLPLAERAGDEEALYQFSSGSTGRPKRVPRTQAMCRAEAENFVATTHLSAADNIFCAISLFHAHHRISG